MPAPLSPQRRAAIADDIRTGELGCNAIARKHGVSPSTVSGIARDTGLSFQNDWMTTTAAECRRHHATLERGRREEQLIRDLIGTQTARRRDGRETKAHRRISYALYDLHRHHDRQWR